MKTMKLEQEMANESALSICDQATKVPKIRRYATNAIALGISTVLIDGSWTLIIIKSIDTDWQTLSDRHETTQPAGTS